MLPAPQFVNLVSSRRIDSGAGGVPATHALSPPDQYSLGLGISEIAVGLEIAELDVNGGVTVKMEWSWDGRLWRVGSTVIAEKTGVDVYTGVFNTAAERTPFLRVIAEIRDTTTTAPVGGTVNAWAVYRYY